MGQAHLKLCDYTKAEEFARSGLLFSEETKNIKIRMRLQLDLGKLKVVILPLQIFAKLIKIG